MWHVLCLPRIETELGHIEMARPTIITPQIQAAIDRLSSEGVSLSALRTALAGEGFEVSIPTLQRYRARARRPPTSPGEEPTGATDLTPAGMAEELRRRYLDVRQVIERVRAEAMTGGPALTRWLRAVDELGATAERLARMVPPTPPDPETDPANVAAKRRLLERIDEELARVH